MIKSPNFLMIGSAGRNVGKTEFVCRVIGRLAKSRPIIAVKITPVRTADIESGCPHGESGCDTCGSLKEKYELSEEHSSAGSKDTARLKAVGAEKVFWLRVHEHAFEEGLQALLQKIPPGSCVVCESGSARLHIQPGAFILIRSPESPESKPVTDELMPLADRVVEFYGDRWSLEPEKCRFMDGKWSVPLAASAAVLAGGKSRRMGQDKSLLMVRGHTLIEHIIDQLDPLADEILIGASDREKYAFTGRTTVPDLEAGQGPLMGILSCLCAAKHDRIYITACDIPVQPAAFVRDMIKLSKQADLVIATGLEGRHEPMVAVYSKSLIPVIRSLLDRGGRKIIDLLQEPGLRVVTVPVPPDSGILNLNTPEDFNRFVQRCE